ncbi:tetratricopeptide repeat protein 7B-like isoform X2 [Daphnia pulex]|uniref:tetratricopeptide repeat protein 7B-like isoform X1 n=1 Tax=Daphnia pulex TaxID=6669 RepID=UPI001EDFBA73|nr:tetratricopeptide repeat protein 7B-like isoform X1 [Daphnia pulex]XP_046456278.1 tetratricopeptide repeat protein 7B-like isoform X2 [Daphnia pulex]
MTSKKSTGKLEIDVQKLRDEGNWKKLIELTEGGKIGINDQLGNFLLGEAKLEQYLEEHMPYDASSDVIAASKTGLSEAKQFLTLSAGIEGSRTTGSMDAQLLLAKLHFACGEYNEALQFLSEAGLDQLTEKPLPVRSLKIIAESFAVQALALEKIPVGTSFGKTPESKEQQLLKSMETAGDIALLYLQEQDKLQGQSNWSIATSGSNSPLPPLNEQRIGMLLETALLRAPLIHIKAQKWSEAIARYRTVLRAMESSATQTLRLTFARQLAEVLLRKMCQGNYWAVSSAKGPNSHWKSKYYTGSSLFSPRDVNEEVFLLLLLSEAMAVRDAVLSQSPEFRDLRKASMRNATVVYDLLIVCCIQHGQTAMLCESLERALKFSFEDAHIWSQFSYSLIAAGKFNKAVLVLKEVARLCPSNPLPCLMAAKVCLEHLNLIDDGFNLATEAVRRAVKQDSNISSRACLIRGVACFIKWRQSRIQPLKQNWMTECLKSLRESADHDPHDHLVHFYLALTHSFCRQVTQALTEVRMALRLRGEHLPSLLLLSLLLSTSAASPSSQISSSSTANGDDEEESHVNQCQGALSLAEATLEEYPNNFDLLYIKTLLEERCFGGEVALGTAKHMLALWKQLYEDSSSGGPVASESNPNNVSHSYSNYDTRSLAMSAISAQHISNDANERESSIYAQSVAAARAEQALSDVTSSMCSSLPKPGPAWHVQLKIWLLTGELYVRLGKCEEALACAQEAALLSPASHHVMYLRGLIHESKNEFAEAKTYFKNATSLSPFHIPSLQHLGLCVHYLGSHRLAEKTLRETVRLDPVAENSWYNLGKVLEAMGDYDLAARSYSTALEVQKSSPVAPFSAVPLCFE